MKSLQLSQIWVYPIKSMGGISVSNARVRPKGLEFDRRWMLIDEQGIGMTQRGYPKMARFKLSLHHDHLAILFEGDTIEVPYHTSNGQVTPAKIWDDDVLTTEVSERHTKWMSERMGVNCKLVFFPEDNARPVDPDYSINGEHVSLADGYPFLIIGQTSLDDLNKKLDHPVPMDRFRPNFVFTGGEPYEEDSWRTFTIGDNSFHGVKPCARCIMTTIDQQKGEKGTEPLRTLSTYRRQGNKTYFGQNLLPIDLKEVRVGDSISVKEQIALPIIQSY